MKTYTVIKEFYDAQDDNRLYKPGDVYPREGAEVSAERIKELSTSDNACKTPLIEEVKSRRSYEDER